jgi:hypothetical protein
VEYSSNSIEALSIALKMACTQQLRFKNEDV